MEDEKATCRGCGRELNGSPYYTGKPAYHPETKERCRSNFYGGHVCSEQCDYRASLELEQTMPGHFGQKQISNTSVLRHIKNNWP